MFFLFLLLFFMTLLWEAVAMSHPGSNWVQAGESVGEDRGLGRPQSLAMRVAVFPFEVRCLLLGALWSALPPLPLPPLALSAQQQQHRTRLGRRQLAAANASPPLCAASMQRVKMAGLNDDGYSSC